MTDSPPPSSSDLFSFLPSTWGQGGNPAEGQSQIESFAPFIDVPQNDTDGVSSDRSDYENATDEAGWISPEKADNADQSSLHEVEDSAQSEDIDLGKGKEKDDQIIESEALRKKSKSSFALTVGDYEKHNEGQLKGYVSYKVHIKTTLAQYARSEFTAERRFSDFFWLHERLKESFRGSIIPPMPDKTIMQNRFDTQFIENRRRELGKFLKELTDHPVLCSSDILQTFLEAEPQLFEKEKTSKPQSGYTKKMMSWVSTTVSQQMSPAVEVDEWFDKKSAYLHSLELKMQEVLRASKALTEKKNETMLLYYDLSVSSTNTASAEENEDKELSTHWTKLSDVNEQIRLVGQEAIANQEIRFEEPISSFLRNVQAAKDALNNRLIALAEFQAAEKKLSLFNEKKAKPNFKSSISSDREFEQLEKKVEETKEEYEMITSSLKKEIERFEATKAKEIRRAMREYAKANMDTTLQIADQWKKLLNQITGSASW